MAHRRLAPWSLIVALIAFPLPASLRAEGAYVVEAQYSFTLGDTMQIVTPFADADAVPWVLVNDAESFECVLFGPFTADEPAQTRWSVPTDQVPEIVGAVPTLCISVEPGPENGFLIRGYIPPTDPFSTDPNLGFLAFVNAGFDLQWITFDADHVEVGEYGGPEPSGRVAWSDDIDRVMTFFLGRIDIAGDSVTHLHGLAIAERDGRVRRVISEWGSVSNGALEGLLVIPDDGRFLVVGHENGSEFLIYDGLESMSFFVAGDIEWSEESVDRVQFVDESLVIVHHPRLDLTRTQGSLTRVPATGGVEFFTRSTARSAEVTDPISGDSIEVQFQAPVLSYATATTATLVRSTGLEFVLHVFDHFNGDELAIQPLSSIDENTPTHMGDARQPDRLVLLTAASPSARILNLIRWEPDEPTPGDYPGGEDAGTGGDTGTSDAGSADAGDDAAGSDGEEDSGCCQTARSRRLPGASLPLLTALLAGVVLLRRRRG